MRSLVFATLLFFSVVGWGLAQQLSPQDEGPAANQAPPRSDRQKEKDREAEAGESSSHDTEIDVSPPKDDAKNHPNSRTAIAGAEGDADAASSSSDTQEMHPWNPYRAVKDVEVGDFYFKRKSYRAALARYQDALVYKDNDAVANFRMAQCYEKLDQPDEAITHYQEYLKILPEGPLSKEAKKALAKLEAEKVQSKR